MAQTKGVLIIDDHPLFREGLKAIIGRDNRFTVVGEAGNGRDGLEMAKQLKPDFVLVDISLPDKSGIELMREIQACQSKAQVVVVSMHSKIDYITEAFRVGEHAGKRLLGQIRRGIPGVPGCDYRYLRLSRSTGLPGDAKDPALQRFDIGVAGRIELEAKGSVA